MTPVCMGNWPAISGCQPGHDGVFRALANFAPEAIHPVEGRTYAELWADYDSLSQPLERVPFTWRGREI